MRKNGHTRNRPPDRPKRPYDNDWRDYKFAAEDNNSIEIRRELCSQLTEIMARWDHKLGGSQ